ncbi:sensor histidine kinase [Hymenobacter terricola]|uniref:sensor histidine kinase n=1 Tax=Hymenobacter terricola TaxID=2819236 RepID=UPI001B3160FF|nr:sensor histidine kinase [Hymenobacter terricola]
MDAPAEVTFGALLLSGVALLLLAGGALVVFLVTYQKRLLRQQLRLHATEAEYQQRLLLAVIEAQESERERIGRDLHDDVASSIAMAKMLVDRLDNHPHLDDAAPLLGLAREVLGNAVEEVRSVSHSLYPAELARAGLVKALENLAELCRCTTSLAVVLEVNYPRPLPLPQELALYRICQELVHNALKHAHGATRLVIRLRQLDKHLALGVEDDGCGFAAPSAGSHPASGGVGLRSIGVRVEMLRARLRQESAPGQGTRTHIELDNPVGATSPPA